MLSSFSASFSGWSGWAARRRGAARLAAVSLASGLAVAGAVVTAGPAAAEDTVRSSGGATATMDGLKTFGTAVLTTEDGQEQQLAAGLFEMFVDGGGTLQTYCVDVQNPTQKDAEYRETPWSGTSLGANKQAGRIRWILQNSYPQVNDLAALAAKAGAGGLTEEDAATGTQVAIWRYSDGAEVTALDPEAEKLADYLEKNARDLAEPTASLTLDTSAVSGRPGDRLGPVTVRTNADGVTVTPPSDTAADGVRVVDAKGEDVTAAGDGSELYFEVPEKAADGSAELTVQASTTVPVGRAFASETRSQTQILAGSSESTVTATATAHWAGKGAIPALSAEKNCAAGGLDLTAANEGDESFTFELMGITYTIEAGETRTVTIPLQEDQAYDFTIEGPNGLAKRFRGVLDCRTETAAGAGGDAVQTLSEPSPATVGGGEAVGTATDLAETGSSGATPVIGGIAIGLVVIGGAVMILLRRRNP
ncbi:TQXA domain-containing protein [Streptomyces scabiei]|uniref:Cys-Gln thioester bond-forming surface protein n=1 Tax=Streptomyces scabiei TaxID=1930 RepID=UPI00298F61F1|nr:TQXA domain-containing protein [Streptomyces scabiei]MDW8804997.1 TQXA domain-containing protein [Streptomyces scabiei]